MEIVGLGIYWNDLAVGREFRTIGRTITEADIVNFIGCTGMLEVLFTDMEYLREHSPMPGRPGISSPRRGLISLPVPRRMIKPWAWSALPY